MVLIRRIDVSGQQVTVYRCHESRDGRLMWKFHAMGRPGDTGFCAHAPLSQYAKSGATVIPSEAEDLSGLRMPAAMDWVHDNC